MVAYLILLLVWSGYESVYSFPVHTNLTNSVGETNPGYTISNGNPAATPGSNCVVLPADSTTQEKLDGLVAEGSVLIYIKMKFGNINDTLLEESSGYVFRPLDWVYSTGRHGRGLLMLQYNYDVLSISTLSIGVKQMSVKLVESPHGCLSGSDIYSIETSIRRLLLGHFKVTEVESVGQDVDVKEQICDLHILNNNGYADFRYVCCHRTLKHDIVCKSLQQDIWLNILLVSIAVLKLGILLFSPYFVPQSWYRLKYAAATYVHNMDQPLNLKVVKTNLPNRYLENGKVYPLSSFENMTEFYAWLTNEDTCRSDVIYEKPLRELQIRVNVRRLVSKNQAPVGIWKSLFDTFVRCKIREKPSLTPCCKSPALKFGSYKLPWYKCLQTFMWMFMAAVMTVPWVLRVLAYYTFEHQELQSRRDAAARNDLQMPFSGSVSEYLTPVHVLFIVVYCVLVIDALTLGVLHKKVSDRFKFVLRKCFRDMRECSRLDACAWAASTMLIPLRKFGIAGIILWVPYAILFLPFIICVLAFYIFPTLNLSIRFFSHFVAFLIPDSCRCTKQCNSITNICYRQLQTIIDKLNIRPLTSVETMEHRKGDTVLAKIVHLLVTLMCLVSLYSLVLLLMEVTTFVVEIFVYTMMGVILNAKYCLKFLSLLFLLVIYGNSCFGGVHEKYVAFNNCIHGLLMGRAGETLKEVALQSAEIQKDTVFKIKPDRFFGESEDDDKQTSDIADNVDKTDDLLKWKTSGLLLFLDQRDTPYLPQKFFFQTCNMPYCGCPGRLLFNLLSAVAHFSVIVVFLLFVFIVVVAFGDVYEISATNQMLATVAGGLLPFMLRNILVKPPAALSLDTNNLSFQNFFNDAIRHFEQKWPIADIRAFSNNSQATDTSEHILETEPSDTSEHILESNDPTNSASVGLMEMNEMDPENSNTGHVSSDTIETDHLDTCAATDAKTVFLVVDISSKK